MGLFDKLKKVIDNSGIVDNVKSKKINAGETVPVEKPECEHGKCYVYNGALCCNCSDDVDCDKKKRYSEENRLESELVDFYKEYAIYKRINDKQKNNHYSDTIEKYNEYKKMKKVGNSAMKLYIKAYQPKLIFWGESIFEDYIDYYNCDFLDNDASRFIKNMQGVDLFDDYYEKIDYIWNSFKNKKLDISLPWIYNSSLYNRSFEEFKYTTNVLNMCSQESFLSSYFSDTSVVDINEFFDENGNIKESGLDEREGDTIFNIIERWSQNNEDDVE